MFGKNILTKVNRISTTSASLKLDTMFKKRVMSGVSKLSLEGKHRSASGCYTLIIRVSRPTTIKVGAMGRIKFDAGAYCYTGSARKALRARIARHLRKDKKLRWHIDYLLASRYVKVTGFIVHADGEECSRNQELAKSPNAVVIERFGSGDCKAGCKGHLVRLPG